MSYNFVPIALPEEAAAVADFMLSEPWPFHNAHQKSTRAECVRRYSKTPSSDEAYFWMTNAADERIGYLKLFDLDDIADQGSPLFDLRIRSDHRGKGVGQIAVRWLSDYLFTQWPDLFHIQGTTREDNIAMRKVFLKCNFAKEGHIRRTWNGVHAAVLYGLLREDWKSGQVTPVPWDDDPAV